MLFAKPPATDAPELDASLERGASMSAVVLENRGFGRKLSDGQVSRGWPQGGTDVWSPVGKGLRNVVLSYSLKLSEKSEFI